MTMRLSIGWTHERVALLKKLLADGLSSSMIAARLGDCSRNAVIGKIHRMGLSRGVTTERWGKKRPLPFRPTRMLGNPPAALRNPDYKAMVAKTVRINASKGFHIEAPAPLPEERQMTSPITFEQLTEKSCRYPSGDSVPFQFCGADKANGSSYCQEHHALCCVPAPRRLKTFAPHTQLCQPKKVAA